MSALPDIKVGTVGYDMQGPQSAENFAHLQQVNSPSEMSDFPTDTYRGGAPTNYGQQSRKKHGAGQPTQQVQQITIDDISPELAAQIVKNYILPMFESDEKKYLKKKYDHLHSPRSQLKKQPSQQPGRDMSPPQETAIAIGVPKTVYGELKLSEQLSF